jgi:hypothetical protein
MGNLYEAPRRKKNRRVTACDSKEAARCAARNLLLGGELGGAVDGIGEGRRGLRGEEGQELSCHAEEREWER